MSESEIKKVWVIDTKKLTSAEAEKHLKEQMKELRRPFSLSGKTRLL